jgi:hypothetical protein
MLPFLLSLLSFTISSSYYLFFEKSIGAGEWTEVQGFTRIIIPDSYMYLNEMNSGGTLVSLLESSVKNTIGPSMIWFIVQNDWILASLFNSFQILFTLLYLSKISKILGIEESEIIAIMIIVALLPATIYHSVGALKEIPSMMLLTGFFYHYLIKDKNTCILYAIIGGIFRSQIVFILIIFWIADSFQSKLKKNSLFIALSILILISAVYPLLKFDAFTTSSNVLFREESGGGGIIGGFMESVRDSVPIISVIAILFRIVQTVFDPILTLISQRGFIENGNISLMLVFYVSSLLICLPSWFTLYISMRNIVLQQNRADCMDNNIIKLYTLCLAFIYPVGGFSFIHYRYLYPVTALLLIAGKTHKIFERHNKVTKYL